MARIRDEWIAGLSSSDARARADSASAIYATGRGRADQALQHWRQEEEFARLVGRDPKVTVGLAVRPETFAEIREANGSPRLADVPAEQDASEFELHFAGDVSLAVLTPRPQIGRAHV